MCAFSDFLAIMFALGLFAYSHILPTVLAGLSFSCQLVRARCSVMAEESRSQMGELGFSWSALQGQLHESGTVFRAGLLGLWLKTTTSWIWSLKRRLCSVRTQPRVEVWEGEVALYCAAVHWLRPPTAKAAQTEDVPLPPLEGKCCAGQHFDAACPQLRWSCPFSSSQSVLLALCPLTLLTDGIHLSSAILGIQELKETQRHLAGR